jgi:hypothetical protein
MRLSSSRNSLIKVGGSSFENFERKSGRSGEENNNKTKMNENPYQSNNDIVRFPSLSRGSSISQKEIPLAV